MGLMSLPLSWCLQAEYCVYGLRQWKCCSGGVSFDESLNPASYKPEEAKRCRANIEIGTTKITQINKIDQNKFTLRTTSKITYYPITVCDFEMSKEVVKRMLSVSEYHFAVFKLHHFYLHQ